MSEERANDCNLNSLVLRLYQARQERARAKTERAAARREAGNCCHDLVNTDGPCWIRNDEDMCEACAKAIPATKEYWRKADAAGAALRAVLRVGRELSQNEPRSDARPAQGDTMKAEETNATPKPVVASSGVVLCSEILSLAISIIEKGPLPESHSEHGEWCPYCAIALAKGQLDDERGTGLPIGECFRQAFSGFVLTKSDAPLAEARGRLGVIEQPFTQAGTLTALKAARTQNDKVRV